MKDNKYYTPEIEEFHVGFEYEYLHGTKGWIDCRFGEPDDWSLSQLDEEIGLLLIRVNYLDREDIESLGWKVVSHSVYIEGEKVIPTEGIIEYGFNQRYILTDILEEFNQYEIKALSGDIFRGAIKSKSELIKLMKQLGICQD